MPWKDLVCPKTKYVKCSVFKILGCPTTWGHILQLFWPIIFWTAEDMSCVSCKYKQGWAYTNIWQLIWQNDRHHNNRWKHICVSTAFFVLQIPRCPNCMHNAGTVMCFVRKAEEKGKLCDLECTQSMGCFSVSQLVASCFSYPCLPFLLVPGVKVLIRAAENHLCTVSPIR